MWYSTTFVPHQSFWNETQVCVWREYNSWLHVMQLMRPKVCHHSGPYNRLGQTEVLLYQSLGPVTSAVVYISHTVLLYWWKYLWVDMLILDFIIRTPLLSMYEIWPYPILNFTKFVYCFCFHILSMFWFWILSFLVALCYTRNVLLLLRICLHFSLSMSIVLHISK